MMGRWTGVGGIFGGRGWLILFLMMVEVLCSCGRAASAMGEQHLRWESIHMEWQGLGIGVYIKAVHR